MGDKRQIVKEYTNNDITVVWKPDLCIHSKICWKGLLEVFNPQNRPWVNMEGSTSERIEQQVKECPSSALSIKEKSNKIKMENDTIKIRIAENGPLFVTGTCEITKADGSVETKEKVTAFCRCGASSNKPFCDGQHRKIEFVG